MADNYVNLSDTGSGVEKLLGNFTKLTNDSGLGSEKILGEFTKLISDTITSSELLSILAKLPTLTDTAESDSKLAVISVFPDVGKLIYPVLKIPKFYDGDIIEYVGGTEQRRLGVALPQYKIILKFASLTESEKDEILISFNFVQGRKKTLLWIDPVTSDRHYVRFFEDVLNINYFYYQLYNLNEVVLIETDIDWEI